MRLRQPVGTLLLHGVLCGQNGEEVTQGIGGAIDGSLPLLHHLEECRLCLCRCAVNLISQQDIRKHGTTVEMELRLLHVEHRRTQNIGRHEIRGELYARELRIDKTCHHLGQKRLCHAWHSFKQHMTIGENSRQHQLHGLFLAYNHMCYELSCCEHLFSKARQVDS